MTRVLQGNGASGVLAGDKGPMGENGTKGEKGLTGGSGPRR